MKRFSPYIRYRMNGEIRCSCIGPDGKKEDSANLNDERIKKIRSMFPPRFRLRDRQEEIMRSILSGRDTFTVLPTGSGKSLCFQAPSVFFPGITLVITPLIALIENQAQNFNNGRYPRYHGAQENGRQENYYENLWFKAIYPGMDGLSPRAMFCEIQNPQRTDDGRREIQYKLLYVSPERLCDQKFLRALREAEAQGLRIPHVVIDEVHCMSQWGFDFRESYLQIAGFIRRRPVRPIISAFTATATPTDRAEIKNLLGFPMKKEEYEKKKYAEKIFVEKRGNLLLCVNRCSDYERESEEDGKNGRRARLKTRKNRLIEILAENPTKVCIIYRTTVAGVDELYDVLKEQDWLKDRLVKYHARLSAQEKSENKAAFLKSYDEADPARISRPSSGPCKNILIATKAFGMGIDKGDISLVIHYDLPRSLEDYYQEAGRAGRNAKRAPAARCYLLYADGPQKEKGTLQYTIQWVLSEKESPGLRCLPLSSQFSDGMREHIYFWSYYRLCYMRAYCEYALQYPDAAQNFIVRYLDNAFTARQAMRELNSFYRYIVRRYPVPDGQRESFEKEYLFDAAAAYRLAGFYPGGTRQKADPYHKELRRLMDEVNELHINNTYVANLLRDHPEKYRLNEAYSSGDDPDCGLNPDELSFTLHGSEKPSYFDLCVLDAVYSIEISGEKTVYVQTIWEILTGRNPRYSSQEKSTFRREIRSSIDKMRSMSLSVCDRPCGFEIKEQGFLPLKDKPEGEKGYSYSAVPPLFRYAEEKNGQIIQAPVSLLNVAKIERQTLWKNDFEAVIQRIEGEEAWDEGGRHAFGNHVKYLPLEEKYEPKMQKLLSGRAYRKLEEVRKRTYAFTPSLENALLCHYLIRRIAISKRRKRGNFIRFATIREAAGIGGEACLFHKKAPAVMDHYRRIGYLYDFALYFTDYPFRTADGEEITDTACFQVQAAKGIKYWRLHGAGGLQLSDFSIRWHAKEGKELPGAAGESRGLCAETRRKLALMPLERMDGMVLRHE